MKSAATHAMETESAYLAGVRANLQAAGNRLVAGTFFKREEHDQSEKVRAVMIDRRIYDRGRYAELPHGRGMTMRGYERRWIFGRRLKSVTVATVMAPPGPLLDGDGPVPPIGLAELREHVRGLIADGKAPHLVGVCSPSGFEENVYNTPLDIPNVHVVLISPRADGGWRVEGASGRRLDERLVRLFDPEGAMQKIGRVEREIADRSIDLLTGGLSASSMARRLELPLPLVQQAFERAARSNPELRVSKQSGEVLLFRGAAVLPAKEEGSMSLAEWIRSLFSSEGEEAKKINILSERRAALSSRLDRMYDDIGKLEKKESQLVEEGKSATSNVVKRRLAAQISHMRKDISRCNTSAAILSKQINVISTHIHNLELAATGTAAALPSSEELTEAAVNAEEILEQLAASDELVSGLEVGLAQNAVSEDEAAILKELQGDEPAASPEGSAKSQSVASRPAAPAVPQREKPQAEG